MLVVASIAIWSCGCSACRTRSGCWAGRQAAQLGGQDADAVGELRPGQAGQRRGLRLVVEGVLPGPLVAQHVLGVVQPGAGGTSRHRAWSWCRGPPPATPRPRRRSSPRPPARSRRGRSPTSARARDSRRSGARAPGRATAMNAVTFARSTGSGPGVHSRSPSRTATPVLAAPHRRRCHSRARCRAMGSPH